MSKCTMNTKTILLSAAAILLGTNTWAQKEEEKLLEQNVQVVRAYNPTISDATKMHLMPVMDDTLTYKPVFDYTLLDKAAPVMGQGEVISPARMNFARSQNTYRSYLKGGVGTYNTLGADYFYNLPKNPDFALGFHVGHLSSMGNLKLENGEKTDAPFHHTQASLGLSRFWNDYTLSAQLDFRREAYQFYGLQTIDPETNYHPAAYPGESVQGYELYPDVNERLSGFKAKVLFDNTRAENTEVNYHTGLGIQAFGTRTGVTQGGFDLSGGAIFNVGGYRAGLDLSVTHFNVKVPDSLGAMYAFKARKNTLIGIDPHIRMQFNTLKLKLGIQILAEIEKEADNFYLLPDFRADWLLADSQVTLFAHISGDVRTNSYWHVADENPFVSADVQVKTASTPLQIEGGVQARLSHRVGLNASVNYAFFKDEHFFVNQTYQPDLLLFPDAPVAYSNHFVPLYDDGGLFTATAVLSVKPGKKSEVWLKAVYTGWNLKELEQAWHKPETTLGIHARAYPLKKLMVTGGLDVMGKRFAFDPTLDAAKTLKAVVDVSLTGEYAITERWAAHVQLNNLAGSRYYPWNGYPGQRFRMMLGASYQF